jgi:hypothetical protein
MMERLRPSLDEAFVIQNQTIALDFIGRRGSATNIGRSNRTLARKNNQTQRRPFSLAI